MFKTLFRDLLGSPLDQWQRESIFINENDNNRKIEQQEKRLCEMNEIANRQASSFTTSSSLSISSITLFPSTSTPSNSSRPRTSKSSGRRRSGLSRAPSRSAGAPWSSAHAR